VIGFAFMGYSVYNNGRVSLLKVNEKTCQLDLPSNDASPKYMLSLNLLNSSLQHFEADPSQPADK
jgi:hypothetical protein